MSLEKISKEIKKAVSKIKEKPKGFLYLFTIILSVFVTGSLLREQKIANDKYTQGYLSGQAFVYEKMVYENTKNISRIFQIINSTKNKEDVEAQKNKKEQFYKTIILSKQSQIECLEEGLQVVSQYDGNIDPVSIVKHCSL